MHCSNALIAARAPSAPRPDRGVGCCEETTSALTTAREATSNGPAARSLQVGQFRLIDIRHNTVCAYHVFFLGTLNPLPLGPQRTALRVRELTKKSWYIPLKAYLGLSEAVALLAMKGRATMSVGQERWASIGIQLVVLRHSGGLLRGLLMRSCSGEAIALVGEHGPDAGGDSSDDLLSSSEKMISISWLSTMLISDRAVLNASPSFGKGGCLTANGLLVPPLALMRS